MTVRSLPRWLYPSAVRAKHGVIAMRGLLTGFPSQLGQDRWVLQMLKHKRGGFFVDIGAADGKMFSNTVALEQKFGWKGICIEPDPASFRKLQQNRSVICDNSCIFDEEKDVEFIEGTAEYGGIAETLSDPYAELLEKCLGIRSSEDLPRVVRRTKTLRTLFKEYDLPSVIDYMSIDTQGSEEQILRSFPFDTHSFLTLTVEHWGQPHRESMKELLERHGYIRVRADDCDDFYCHSSIHP